MNSTDGGGPEIDDLRQLGPYVIVGVLGEGGMGRVYRARHATLDRDVALKVCRPRVATAEDPQLRFRREMMIAARLRHPSLVRIHDGGIVDGIPYIAMELVEGETLHEVLSDSLAIPWPAALAIASRIAQGLIHLQENDLVHRDIKPSNILLDDSGAVKLADFGLIRPHAGTVLTAPGSLIGTIAYMAPELIEGASATNRSDAYALGGVLYRALVGRGPVRGNTIPEQLQSILNDPIRPPVTLVDGLPREVSRLVMRLLSRDPTHRPADGAGVAVECDRLILELASTTTDEILAPGLRKRLRESGVTRVPSGSDVSLPTIHVPEEPTARIKSPARVAAPGTSSSWKAMSTTFVGLAAVAVAWVMGSRLVARERRMIGPPSLRSPPATESRVPTTGIRRRSTPLERWREFEHLRKPLRERGTGARAVVTELRRTAPFDLGPATASWLHWFDLGRWLDESMARGDVPRRPGSATGLADLIEQKMLWSYLALLGDRPCPEFTATAVQQMRVAPGDDRSWLLLGRAVELEGRAPVARRIYDHALSAGTHGSLTDAPLALWSALVHASMSVDAHSIGDRFLGRIDQQSIPWEAWQALGDALRDDRPDTLRTLLETGRLRTNDYEPATMELARLVTETGGSAKGRAILEEGMRLRPLSDRMFGAAIDLLLTRGLLGEATSIAALAPRACWQVELVRCLSSSNRPEMSPTLFDFSAYRRGRARCEAQRHLALGDAPAAARAIEHGLRESTQWDPDLLVSSLPVLDRLSTRPALVEAADRLLKRFPDDGKTWALATDCLRSRSGASHLLGLARQLAANRPESIGPVVHGLLTAARQGGWRDAVGALAAARKRVAPRKLPDFVLCEVLTRAFWNAEGQHAANGTLKPLLEDPGPGEPLAASYWSMLRSNRREEAARVAEDLFDRHPDQLVWALVVVRHARSSGELVKANRWTERLKIIASTYGFGLGILEELVNRTPGN